MGRRLKGVAVVIVVLLVGAFLGSAASQWWPRPDGPVAAPREDEVVAPPGERVRVEVLNGGGREGMAREATDRLRDRGFDVVYYGNAESFDHDTSVVLDRVDRPDFARAVADALGIPSVRAEPDSNLYLEVSVVLGASWEPPARDGPGGPGGAPGTGEVEAVPAWWDIRRFFREDEEPRPDTPDAGSRGRLVDPGDEGSGGR